jgi:hypothetical protein
MNQTNAIEKNSVLRTLPLPGRQDNIGLNGTNATVRPPKEVTQTDGTLTVAGRSQQAENLLYVSYGPINLAQAANVQLVLPRAVFTSGRQPLADGVVSYLLQNNETATDKGATSTGGTSAAGLYQSAAGGFPRRSDSLFSLIS